jgi:hypothetical protein
MAINPYSKKTVVVTKTGNELSESRTALNINPKNGKLEAGAGAFEDKHGEINAGSKKEVMQRIGALALAASQGDVQEQHEFANQRAELVEAAMADKSGETWRVVGEVLGDEILETMGRDGFLRKVMMRKDLKKGEIGRLRVRKKDVMAFYATTDSTGVTSQINQFYLFPDEFYVKAHILIEDRELEQAPGDLLDDKYIDGLEQMMVKEDQVLKGLLDVAATSYNDPVGFTTFSPSVFAQSRTQIQQWGNPCATGIIAMDLWNDILSDPEFATYFDPVTKREVIMSGSLGSFYGVNLITDGFRYDTLQVLQPGEFYFLSAPNVLGAQTVRKDVTTAPINMYLIGKPERGWYMQKIMGLSVANGRAVVHGVRT